MNDEIRDLLLVIAAIGVGYFLVKEGKTSVAVGRAVKTAGSLTSTSTTTSTTTSSSSNSAYNQYGSPDGNF